MKSPWPHQREAEMAVQLAIHDGYKRILLAIPTGGGKTYVAASLIRLWVAESLRVTIYTNRRLMVEQLSAMLTEYGIPHGIRASGHARADHHPVQICSIQTEQTRTRKAKDLSAEHVLHDSQRVVVDEAHLNCSEGTLAILNQHIEAGASVLGLTATPIDLGHFYEHLIQAGLTSELRACGALVEALHFGPDEPDLAAFKRLKKLQGLQEGHDLSEAQARALIMTPTIWGRVYEWFERLNPDHRPTILFAPGVGESLWFAEQFSKKGISAAHIDGKNIWLKGELFNTSQRLREEVLDGSRNRKIVVLCNRFVLREGIDAPWLAHGIFATVFGSLQTYLQSGGRLLRAGSGLDSVTIQDHGGNWHRHGSLNADRTWDLDLTASMISGLRADAMREGKIKSPFRCPECAIILMAGRCPNCGWRPISNVVPRPVVGTDGALRMMRGDIYKKRFICQRADGPSIWERMYWRSKTEKGRRTFRAAFALFAQENYWQWPDPAWPFMPKDSLDSYRLVGDVPFDRLIPKENSNGQEKAEASGGYGAGDDS